MCAATDSDTAADEVAGALSTGSAAQGVMGRAAPAGRAAGTASLRELHLRDNPIGDGALDALLRLVRHPMPLEMLQMQGSKLSQSACHSVRFAYEPNGMRRLTVMLDAAGPNTGYQA